MRSDLLQHELARTSAVFGRKDDVRVVFRADAALTDGSTIVLPSMGSGLDVDDETEWIYVENVDQLATEGIGLLAKVLLGERRRAA